MTHLNWNVKPSDLGHVETRTLKIEEIAMPKTEVGDCVVTFLADTKALDAQLAKIQRAIQAMRDVLNEDEVPKFIVTQGDNHIDIKCNGTSRIP